MRDGTGAGSAKEAGALLPGGEGVYHLSAQCERNLQGPAAAQVAERGGDHRESAQNVPPQGHAQHRAVGAALQAHRQPRGVGADRAGGQVHVRDGRVPLGDQGAAARGDCGEPKARDRVGHGGRPRGRRGQGGARRGGADRVVARGV